MERIMAQRKKYFPPLPAWGGPFEKWARNYVNKNHWRAAHVFGSEEDSLQECAAVFARCLRTYQGKVDNPAWFMSLFKISVINEWNTVSIKDAHQREMYDADADAD